MKVILTEDVVGLGEPGTIVDVAPGYARNYLVPRKLAVYANTGSVKELEHHKRHLERKRQRLQAVAMSTAERLATKPLTIIARVGQGGKLYGSVTSPDIAQAIKAQFELDIDRRKIHVAETIRTIGSYVVDIHLMGGTHAKLTVDVIEEGKPVVPAAEAAAE
jgi:large subunit ribosomal protein L9